MGSNLLRTPPLVWVEWIDACGSSDWTRKITELSRCVSVGFVLRDDEDVIVVAQSFDRYTGNWDHQIAIPKKCVTRKRRLPKPK